MTRRVLLVFAPHPDDEIIGCGASIVKHLGLRREVYVAFAGNTTDIQCATMSSADYQNMREEEIPRAMAKIGIDSEHIIMGSENNPWHYSEERLRIWALEVIRKTQPDTVYLPHLEDEHVDHNIVARAVLAAIGMAPSPWFHEYEPENWDPCRPVETVLGYEVWTPIKSPNYFEAVSTSNVESAMNALRAYESQEADKYEKAYLGRAAYRAAMHEGETTEYAEAFVIYKATRLL